MVRRIPKQVRQPQVLDVHMSFRLVGRMRMSKVLPHERFGSFEVPFEVEAKAAAQRLDLL